MADREALRLAFQTGRINTGGGGLGATPIIDLRYYADPSGDVHDRFRTFSTRARLLAASGRADNQVILTLPPVENPMSFLDPNAPFNMCSSEALRLMDQWLDNIAQDRSMEDLAGKVARDKPAELVDACWTAEGEKIVEPETYDGPGRCNDLFPNHGDPRVAAGGPVGACAVDCW